MERCQSACRCLCVLFLCSLGLLRVGLSQSCDTVSTAGIQSVSFAQESTSGEYGLFLNLQSPVPCTGKVTEFEYAYYKGSGNKNVDFIIELSLWRPGGDGTYTEVHSQAIPVTTSQGNAGLIPAATVLLQNHVYVASGDVVGLYSNPSFLATLVDSGTDEICTSASDTNTLDCSVTSALVDRRLRVRATVEPILCSLDALSIDQGTFTVNGTNVTESQPVNTVITYECNSGLVLIGSAERTCEIVENSVDGEWNGSAPSCEESNVMPSPTSTEPLPSGILGSLTDSIAVSFTMDVSVITDSSQDGPALPTMEPIGTTSFDVVTSVTISSMGSTVSDASATMSQELIGVSTSDSTASLLVETVTEAVVPHVTASITVGPMQVPSGTGASAAVIAVIIVVFFLLVLGIVGVIVVFTLWRRHRKIHIKGTANMTASGLDNPISHIAELYEVPLVNGNNSVNGDPQCYTEIKSGTAVSFHKQDLGTLNEARMHYEFDEVGEYDVVREPTGPVMEYEEPGVIFTTDTAGKEFRTASQKGKGAMLGYVNSPTFEQPPGYYTALSSTSQYYKLFEQAMVPDDDISEDDDDDDDLSRRATKKYVKPAGETEALIKQINRTKVKRIQANAITLLEHIGSGQYGEVHKALWKTSNGQDTEVAVKQLKTGAFTLDRIKFLQEAAIMAQFTSQNVLKLLGMVTQGEDIMLVMELMSNGDLRDYLIHMRPETREGHSLPADTNLLLLGFCRQVCLGMTYLSGKGFVHRDLAARNILISSDRICKISDFGMARDVEDESYYFSQGGKIPVRWTAPEAINYRKYSTFSDVWSYGCLMYEIWSVGQKPYGALSHEEVVERISSTYRLPPPPGCPRSQYEIMISTWHPVPKKRPDFHDIMLLLLQHDTSVLEVPKEALSSHPQAGKLAAALVAGKDMYPDLQNKYENVE